MDIIGASLSFVPSVHGEGNIALCYFLNLHHIKQSYTDRITTDLYFN